MKPTEAQTRAIESRAARICVSAGAGSGKTRVLVERMVQLLEHQEAPLDEIVAITFTEKAAAEMKARLRGAFRERAPEDDAEAMSFWREQERNLENARISTIHSFCIGLLREHALHLGLDPEFSIVGEAEEALLKNRCVREVLMALLEQRDPAAMRIATEYRTEAIEAALLDGIRQRSALGAFLELPPYQDPDALRGHWRAAVEAEKLRRVATLKQHPAIPALLARLRRYDGACTNPDDAWEAWRSNAKAMLAQVIAGATPEECLPLLEHIQMKTGRGSKKNWAEEGDMKAVEKLKKEVDKFAQGILGPPEGDSAMEARCARMTVDFLAIFGHVDQALREAMVRDAVLDFDEVIRRTRQALRDEPTIRERVAQSIRFLLIDEFQDTDSTQLEIAQLLHGCTNGPKLFVVGDAKQSIYYFRGAEVEVFDEVRQKSEETINLDRNFRSMPEVMGFINTLFARSDALAAVEAFQPMDMERTGDGLPRVGIQRLQPPDDPEAKWLVEDIRRAEAEQIAARILAYCDGETTVLDEATKTLRTPNFGDIAILFRTTSNVGIYQEALRRAGIPYLMASGAGFYRQQEITDLLNVLHVLADPWDDAALLAFLRGPMAGLTDDTLTWMARQGPLCTVFSDSTLWEGVPERALLEDSHALIQDVRGHLADPVVDLLRHVVMATEYEAVLLGQHLGIQRFSNVRKLLALAEQYDRQPGASLRGFIHYVQSVKKGAIREAEAPLLPEHAGAVSLMTIHKSKGLEFPLVILPDMAEGKGQHPGGLVEFHSKVGCTLPVLQDDGDRFHPQLTHAIKQRRTQEEQEESSRLLYVALTRARDGLLLCGHDAPKPASWFAMLDGAFNLLACEPGQRTGVAPGEALVLDLQDSAPRRPRAQAQGKTDWESHFIRVRDAVLPAPEPGRDTVSVSRLLDALAEGHDLEEERPREVDPNLPAGPLPNALLRGTLVHRMFELWDFDRACPPPWPPLLREAAIGLSQWDGVTADLDQVAARFQRSEAHTAIAAGQPLQREQPFRLRIGPRWLIGTLDLVLADGTILDYKTGKCSPARQERYTWQLLLYAHAYHTLRRALPPRALIYYADEGRLEEIALGPDAIANAAARAAAMAEHHTEIPLKVSG